ncbi:MAG: hypothetical protein QW727_03925 [Candidatus Pacearchaeota archaeon]
MDYNNTNKDGNINKDNNSDKDNIFFDKLEEWVYEKEPNEEDIINRKIIHISFAKVVLWLCYKSKKEDMIFVNELRKYLKVSRARAYEILNDFVEIGILDKKVIGNLSEYHFVKNNHHPKIDKYFEKAKKTLGLV